MISLLIAVCKSPEGARRSWLQSKRKIITPEEHMEEPKQEAQPTIGEYQGKPIIRIPTVDNPNPETTWHWMSFGKNKAKAIIKYFDAIKKFAEE